MVILTEIHRSALYPLNMRTEIHYSQEAERNVAINTLVTSTRGNHRCEMNITHPATQLELRQVLAYERNPSGRSQIIHTFSHARMDAELLVLEHLLVVEPQEKKIYFTASSPMLVMRHLAQMTGGRGNQSLFTYEAQHDEAAPIVAELNYNPDLPFVHFVAQYDPTNTKSVQMRAGIPDRRQMILELFRLDRDERIPIFDFVLRLNHSQLLTSKTRWPTDWRKKLFEISGKVLNTISISGDQWWAAFVTQTISETSGSVLYIVNDIYEVLNTALDNFIYETDQLATDYRIMEQNVIDGYNTNAFYAKVAIEMIGAITKDIPFGSYAENFLVFLEKTANRLIEPFSNESDSFTKWWKNISHTIRVMKETILNWMGDNWEWPSSNKSWKLFLEYFGSIFRSIAQEYDQFAKRLHQSLSDTFYDITVPLQNLIEDSWEDLYLTVRPIIIRGFITIETITWNVMKDVLDYLYEQRDVVARSTYFQKLSLLLEDLKQLYVDMQSVDWASKINGYISRIANFLQQKYTDLDEYLMWLERLKAELETLYDSFLKENPELDKGAESGRKLVSFLLWSYRYLELDQKLPQLLSTLRERGVEMFQQTATDARLRYSPQKTLFRFNPELGFVELEQKLPMPWISLHERPRFEELPEIRRINSFLSLFQVSNKSVVNDLLSQVPESFSISNWLPPFKSKYYFYLIPF